MKKILLALISCIIVFNTLCPLAFADSEFKISKGSILNGETEATVSALITYEFTEEIDVSTDDTAEVSDMVAKDVSAVGKKLYIRLNSKLKYNTSYTVNLSGIKSSSGKSLPASEQSISFKTKPGAEKKIIEEDFETLAIDTSVWRDPGQNKIEIATIDSAADNGNYSYKIVNTNFDMYTNNPLYIDTKAILDFDFYFGELTSNYEFFTIIGKDANGNTFESTGNKMLKYNYTNETIEIKQIGTWETTVGTGASYCGTPTGGTAVKVTGDSWNNMRIVVDMKNLTFRVAVNGEVISDTSGTVDFKIPFSSYNCTSQPAMTNVRIHPAANGYPYYDNVSYREYCAPKIVSSTVKENSVINASCLELNLSFDSDVESLELKLNDDPVSSDALKQTSKRTYTCYFDDLAWSTSYCLTGTVSVLYDTKGEFTINFSTPAQPSQLIEVAGFYNDGGDRLDALSSGEISARLKIWQGMESKNYTIVAGVYKRIGDAVEMLGLQSADYILTASDEKTIKINVPGETENCFVKIYVLDNSTERNPYQQSVFSGNRILE